jgi:hypothetical protein
MSASSRSAGGRKLNPVLVPVLMPVPVPSSVPSGDATVTVAELKAQQLSHDPQRQPTPVSSPK